MSNAWTGGQYSLYRAVFGIYLAIHFAALLPWGAEVFSDRGVLPDGSASPLLHAFPNLLALADSPLAVTALLGSAVLLSLAFAIGWWDRAAAVGIWYVLACLFGRNPLIANPSLPFLGWLLLAHAALPPGPYGSLAARGRVDPRGGWSMPPAIYAAAWIVLAVGYSYSGATKLVSPSWVDGSALARVLDNPLARPSVLRDLILAVPDPLLRVGTWVALALELFFAPLALSPRLRPWLWAAMLGMHVGLMTLIDFAELSFGMILVHAFTFDPAWLPQRRAGAPERVFYDGHCALCHGAVRFLLAEDHGGAAVRFAPIESESFMTRLTSSERRELPDSIVVLGSDGQLRVRFRAVLHLLDRLGGVWRILAWAGAIVPARLGDFAYDRLAASRRRLFGTATEACPLLPSDLRLRFDL